MTASNSTTTGAGPAAARVPGQPAGSEPMLLYLVKQVELAIRSHLDDLLRPAGLTALQYTALTVLEHHPDLSSAQLARNSFVTAQSMADMITTLEGRGLIERHRDWTDRRRLVVALTSVGRDLLDRYRDQMSALEEQMLAGLTRPQVSSLRRSLHACHANLAGRGAAEPDPDLLVEAAFERDRACRWERAAFPAGHADPHVPASGRP